MCANCEFLGAEGETCTSDDFINFDAPNKPAGSDKLPYPADEMCSDWWSSNKDLTPKNVALYIVRHGETELNADNSFRGFVDVDLNAKGRAEAARAAQFLGGIRVAAAYSSDLKRAAETLDILLRGQKTVAQRLVSIRPWNIGDYAGKPKSEENRAVIQNYADNPDKLVPNGESLSKFRSRYKNAFNDILDGPQPAIVVQHASNNHEVGNILYGDIMAVDAAPGSVIGVYRSGKKLEAKILFGGTETSESYT